MADTLIFEVQATSKGLKVVQKDTKELADQVERTNTARDKAGKSQDSYNKREKGIAQSNLSSAKGFSKMNQTMGGSSGLVGAYATLAANVFAATAAFNALRKAAQLQQLIEGLELVGAAAGRNLTFAADKLREVSGYALSTDQAMRNMALGISAGFSTEQMTGLTEVARGASIALGRDMGDAMDRLTRGAAKLEPEILDELGIMVRLDQATQKYADTMNKAVTSLSQFERRQAFLNAILEQGDKKFGTLSKSIDPNSYDKLSASLSDLVKELSNLVNKALGPVVEILSNNMGALTAVLVLFASTITRQLMPGLSNMAKGAADAATSTANTAKAQLKQLKTTEKMPDAYTAATKAMQKGNITQKDYNKGMNSLIRSSKMHQVNLDADTVKYKKGNAEHKRKTLAIRENKKAMDMLTNAYRLHQVAQAKSTAANAVEAAQNGQFILGTKLAIKAMQEYSAVTMAATAGMGALARAQSIAKVGFFGLATAAKTAGAAIMSSLGWVSMVASMAFMLYEIFKEDLFPTDQMQESADEIIEALDSVKETAKSFQKTMEEIDDPAHVAVAGYKALQGVLTELKGHMLQHIRDSKATNILLNLETEKRVAAEQKIIDEGNAAKLQNTTGFTSAEIMAHRKAIEAVSHAERRKASIQKKAREAQTAAVLRDTDNLISFIDKTTANIASQPGFKDFSKAQLEQLAKLKEYVKNNPALGAEEVQKRLDAIIAPIGSITSAFEGAQDAAANFSKEINKLQQKQVTPFDGAIRAAEVLEQQFLDLDKGLEGMKVETPFGMAHTQKTLEEKKAMETALSKMMGTDVTVGGKDGAAVTNYVKQLKTARQTLIESKARVKELNKEHSKSKDIAKKAGTVGALKVQLDLEEKIRKVKLKAAETTIAQQLALRGNIAERLKELQKDPKKNEEAIKALLLEKKDVMADIADIEVTRKGLAADEGKHLNQQLYLNVQAIEQAKELISIRKKGLADQKADLSNQEKIYKSKQQLAILEDPARVRGRGITTSKGEDLTRFYEFEAHKRDMINNEYNLKIAMIAMEHALLSAKLIVLKAELKSSKTFQDMSEDDQNALLKGLDAAPEAMRKARVYAYDAAKSTRDAALYGLDVERAKLQIGARKELVAGAGSDNITQNIQRMREYWKEREESARAKIGRDHVAAAIEANKGKPALTKSELDKIAADAATSATDEEVQKAAGQTALKDKIAMMQNMASPLINQLKALGPEGELVAQVAQGAFIVADAWAGVGETFKLAADKGGSTMEKFAAVADAVSATIASAAAISRAASNAKVAAIDDEIAAEKKRDGKSDQSLAKIKGLEKKKDQMKRKAFESNKKMMIASAIASTAAGMIGVFAGVRDPLFSMPLAIASAAIIGAMGLAQIAVIAGTSYSGGGSAGGSSMPKAVNAGEKSNKVDVSKSGNTSGELAYLRGEKGIGTSASDFRPGAFAGKRYRAAGGTAYVVGEQGPELFLPEVPGQVVSNDNAASMGAPMNVSFQVSAIDSTNMQDMLTTQRGNIISMIREAANSHGTGFLENVDVSTYQEQMQLETR